MDGDSPPAGGRPLPLRRRPQRDGRRDVCKLSLSLATLAKGKPFSFLDHAIRHGDSLLGIVDIDEVWAHNPDDRKPDIVRLRELHVELDYAVCDAYGWKDLDLGHGFHPVRGRGIRYTFSPDVAVEVLYRLLELNRECYEEEVRRGSPRRQEQEEAEADRPHARPVGDLVRLMPGRAGEGRSPDGCHWLRLP